MQSRRHHLYMFVHTDVQCIGRDVRTEERLSQQKNAQPQTRLRSSVDSVAVYNGIRLKSLMSILDLQEPELPAQVIGVFGIPSNPNGFRV